jgi:uncharacterized protein (DUF2384 family)
MPPVDPTNASATMTDAILRTAHLLVLPLRSLAQILGLPSTLISRMVAGTYELTEGEGEAWQRAILFLRVYCSLEAVFGDPASSRQWLESDNKALSGSPADLICSRGGLERVLQYLDAQLGRA